MMVWDDNDIAWIINPPLWRYEGSDILVLIYNIAVLFVLSFIARKPIAEWARGVFWLVRNHVLSIVRGGN